MGDRSDSSCPLSPLKVPISGPKWATRAQSCWLTTFPERRPERRPEAVEGAVEGALEGALEEALEGALEGSIL